MESSSDRDSVGRSEIDPPDETSSVLVTGGCGRLGRRLIRALHRDTRVVSIDKRAAPGFPEDVEHHALDLLSKSVRDVFRHIRARAIVHLGITHDPRLGWEQHHAWNLLAIQRVLEFAEQFGIPKVVLLSSANVYGPRPDNAQFLREEAPLLAAGRFTDIGALVEIDLATQSFLWRQPHINTVILRPVHILGSVRNAPSNYLRLKRVPTLLGFDPMMQVVHQDDVVSSVQLALKPEVRGIFNLAGPAPVILSRAIQLLGRSALPLPHGAARYAVERMFRWRMTSFPAAELDFIRYVCMADDTRARTILGYAPRHDLASTLAAVDAERWVD
ncbi:MAG TPA: NAD-dependent epimerase/dehydratase family protein [Polyangiaceae bacterium]|nr:NAD-dependent epimerase/dehydratase family protein [Polyangiaceae bacterium]